VGPSVSSAREDSARSRTDDPGGFDSDTGGFDSDTGGIRTDTGGIRTDTGGIRTDTGGFRTDTGGLRAGSAGEAPGPQPFVPVRRLLSLGMAGLSLLLAVALVVGAQLAAASYALVVLGVQVLYVIVGTIASQPPAPRIVAAVGVGVALASAAADVLVSPASLAPLVYLTVGGFVAAVIGQLLRPAGRVRVTESLGSALVIVLGVIAFATLVVLSRRTLGDQVIVATVVGAGVALIVAHLVDMVAPLPRVAPAVPRGGLGVVVGAMLGTAAAGLAGHSLDGLFTLRTAFAGLAAAVIALMVDLSANYAEAGRQLAGSAPALWLVRHMYGPLSAFALAAPTAYAANLLLARGL